MLGNSGFMLKIAPFFWLIDDLGSDHGECVIIKDLC
jgi:hypothetical protein